MAKKHDEEKLNKNHDKELDETATDNLEEMNSEEEINETKEEDAAQEEIRNLNDRLLRLQADFLNYKTRTEKEKVSSYGNATADLILDLLQVVDNFERALAADSTDGSSYKEGIQMVYNQMMGILDKKGLREVEALHKPFDHNIHYGVAFEASEDYDDGIVIDVLQKGYTVNERCIRPAMVRICRK